MKLVVSNNKEENKILTLTKGMSKLYNIDKCNVLNMKPSGTGMYHLVLSDFSEYSILDKRNLPAYFNCSDRVKVILFQECNQSVVF